MNEEQTSALKQRLETLIADAAAGTRTAESVALLQSEALPRIVSDPALSSSEDAAAIAKAATAFDPRFDTTLLTSLSSASANWPGGVSPPRAMRVLEILEQISDCRRLLMPLVKFLKIPDPKVRSKAVKLIARASQNGGWFDSILADADPRVRANLIEGLLAQMGRRAEPILRRAARDPHHRVAAIALFGLAQLGDPLGLKELVQMSTDPREPHRKAALRALAKLEEATPSSAAPHRTA
jgi:HEAT repeat protein